MTLYELNQNDTREADAGANAEEAAKPSLFARIRRAFTPKIPVWLITPAGRDDAQMDAAPAEKAAADEALATLEIRRATCDRRAFAAMIRVMCGSAPLGLDFETDEEIGYWLSAAEAALAEQEGRRDDAHEEEAREEKAEEEENPSAPLDKRGGKDHNVSESEDNAGARRGPGRPRKKGGSAKKAPGSKKGGPNEN